jgi:mono/diheme cytochrome c family protein
MSSVAAPGIVGGRAELAAEGIYTMKRGYGGVWVFAASLLAAGCSNRFVEEPSGRDVYLRHCASCHGDLGKGDGPVAASLKRPPTDLTAIAQRAGGSFDERRVMQVIDGRALVAEHGTRSMPVWGVVFEEEHEGEPYAGYTSLLRSRNLTDYLRSIQR